MSAKPKSRKRKDSLTGRIFAGVKSTKDNKVQRDLSEHKTNVLFAGTWVWGLEFEKKHPFETKRWQDMLHTKDMYKQQDFRDMDRESSRKSTKVKGF